MRYNNIQHLFNLLLPLLLQQASANKPPQRLLNAYHSPLSSLTSPHSYYFLEFPLSGDVGNNDNEVIYTNSIDSNSVASINKTSSSTNSPMCADGSPYSFLFRRGSDKHLDKLIVEFEGGPACWDASDESSTNGTNNNDGGLSFNPNGFNTDNSNTATNASKGCSCSAINNASHQRSPWYEYQQQGLSDTVPLGSCTGVPEGFVSRGAKLVLGDGEDVPLFLRGEENDDLLDGSGTEKKWWERLSGENTDIDDWSYILLPHCTLDWHLGRQAFGRSTGCSSDEDSGSSFGETIVLNHRGARNVQSVLDWVVAQYSPRGGLDALVTVSSGKIGGCHSTETDKVSASSVASLLFAKDASLAGIVPPSSALVIIDGASLFNENIPSNTEMVDSWHAELNSGGDLLDSVIGASVVSSKNVQIAWVASSNKNSVTNEELEWIDAMKQLSPDSFHAFMPLYTRGDHVGTCPSYAFSDESVDEGFSEFIVQMTSRMAWPSPYSESVSQQSIEAGDRNLSFLSILVILLSLFLLIWGIFFVLKRHRLKNDQKPPPSPSDLWFKALTQYPVTFFFVSLLIPIVLSYVAYAKAGYTVKVNLDFDSYLGIDTEEERVAVQYANLVKYQVDSLKLEEENCASLYTYGENITSSSNRVLEELVDPLFPLGMPPNNTHRGLQGDSIYSKPNGRTTMSIFYQNRNGGNVFTPQVLQSIRQFEQSIRDFPGFEDYCYGISECLPFDSLIPYFYPDGETLVDDIDDVLSGFLGSELVLLKMDKYFGIGSGQLASNITQTTIWFDQSKEDTTLPAFLERLHHDLLWKADHDQTYPELVFSWANSYVAKVEADDALNHDAVWSLAVSSYVALLYFDYVRIICSLFLSFPFDCRVCASLA
jgi:hypothetical protein